jgi:carbonic anhydrase
MKKKLLRTLFIIILIAGFFVVKKNTQRLETIWEYIGDKSPIMEVPL